MSAAADGERSHSLLRIYADEEGSAERARLRRVAETEPDPELRAEARRLLEGMENEP